MKSKSLLGCLWLALNIATIAWSADHPTPGDDESSSERPANKEPAATEPDGASSDPADDEGVHLQGHSAHGEAFNEGPRQQAYLMGNTGYVNFPVTAAAPLAQAFFDQGVGQLHGFWYFEAERSFRQVALLDPQCAMAYWGMALANTNNAKRARGFIAEAVKYKHLASERERMYIEALAACLQGDDNRKKPRAEAYARALESIALKYPQDAEAKALLVLQLYLNRDLGIPVSSYLAVDALLGQIFAVNPMHPAHHYRIHLWDEHQPNQALLSAARCGQAATSIAHMWHMPGHIYTSLKRYEDACWHQEAAARVDHAHMMRDRVLPDQIHNFTHNNEWLVRDLMLVGRVHDAVSLAKNMIELPRHPKYNTLDSGSHRYGRMRLYQTLTTYELWEEMIALSSTSYLEPTHRPVEQTKRLRQLGVAWIRQGDVVQGQVQLSSLRERLRDTQQSRDQRLADAELTAKETSLDAKQLRESLDAAETSARAEGLGDDGVREARKAAEQKYRDYRYKVKAKDIAKARNESLRSIDTHIRAMDKAILELEGHLAVASGEHKRGYELLKNAGQVDSAYLALVQVQTGDHDAACKAIRNHVRNRPNEVQPLAMQIQILWHAGKKDEAKKAFESLREVSGSLDTDVPVIRRLTPIAEGLGLPTDWRIKKAPAADIGIRPPLDMLGPFRWQPAPAPGWNLVDAQGTAHSLQEYSGRPLVVIFYLGASCLHCAEQLQKFAPMKEPFEQAGFSLVAISSDDQAILSTAVGNYGSGGFPFQLLSDAKLDAFKAYRCYDDFERLPLHGTFVLDGAGRVRWQDISYEPFMDAAFVLEEAKRLLAHGFATPANATPVASGGAVSSGDRR